MSFAASLGVSGGDIFRSLVDRPRYHDPENNT
jgi:hypothetical protein